MEAYSGSRKRDCRDYRIRDRKKNDYVWQGGDWVGWETILGSRIAFQIPC